MVHGAAVLLGTSGCVNKKRPLMAIEDKQISLKMPKMYNCICAAPATINVNVVKRDVLGLHSRACRQWSRGMANQLKAALAPRKIRESCHTGINYRKRKTCPCSEHPAKRASTGHPRA